MNTRILDDLDRHTYAVGYAYPGSPTAYKFRRSGIGTWYVDRDGEAILATDTAGEANAYVTAKESAGHLRSKLCQSRFCTWGIIIRNEAAIAAAFGEVTQ